MFDESNSPQSTALAEIDMAAVPLTIAEQREMYAAVIELRDLARQLKAVAEDPAIREAALKELTSKIPGPIRGMLGL